MAWSVARVGAWTGWMSLLGIAGYHLLLLVVAGQRVSGTSDVAAIRAYYSNPAIGAASIEQFLVVIAVTVFAVALRETLIRSAAPDAEPMLRLLTNVAMVAITIELAVILVESSLQTALVTAARAGEPIAGLFRLWDVLYNSAAYGLEATWVLTLGLAMHSNGEFPAFLRWFSPLTAILLAINIFALWIGIPDAATLPSALAIAIWLAAASIGLGRLARLRLGMNLATQSA
jgi:hypothetical protein